MENILPAEPLVLLLAALAVFIVALSKSGLVAAFGMIGVPLLTLAMPARQAAGIMLPLLILMDVIGLLAYRRQVNWPNIRLLLPPALLGIGIGWLLWAVTSESAVRLMIGIITLAFLADSLLPLRKSMPGRGAKGPLSWLWGWFWGGLAGFTSFVSHTGGPPFQIYVLPQRLPPAVFAGTSVVFFSVVNAVKLIPYAALGQLSFTNLSFALFMAPVALVGMLVGIYLVRRIEQSLFYRIAYTLMAVLGVKLIWDGITGMI
ncbi:sulfite exporter TauE/SafE family protein [Cucumibacter marinus]|uniref:sulfite exporter TauE/SafE family protein n=1 Tax=Cucumibacter marinus TaxID=1121252 RepID=UPI000423BC46|nr:sulfite exporter TauE/SafE family protein [Cucumibacter marinus]